jgi:hypothetical protein
VVNHAGLSLPGLDRLEEAALNANQDHVPLRRILEQVVRDFPVAGTAVIRPSTDGTGRWQTDYVGPREAEMRRWVSARLDDSLEATVQYLREKPPCLLDVTPVPLSLRAQTPALNGLWILWLHADLSSVFGDEELDDLRRILEALLEVELKEKLYFHGTDAVLGSELKQSIAGRESLAFPTLLTAALMVTNADLTYLGIVNGDALQVRWHLGAKDPNFTYKLPIGEGVGGRAFESQRVYEIIDYLNCQYRYPGVSDACDREEIRSKLVVPIRSHPSRAGAVLYAARRKVAPFSISERLTLLRLVESKGSLLDKGSTSSYFFPSEEGYLCRKRSELRNILLHSDQVRDIESWLERAIRGPAILVDCEEQPYVYSDTNSFERLNLSPDFDNRAAQTIPLAQSGADERGYLRIWPSVSLPPTGWPDFFEDVVAACNVVIDRMERVNNYLSRQRLRWLKEVTEKTTTHLLCEGHRLGLPVDQGEVWAIAWPEEEIARGPARDRLEMLLEDVALEQLGSPLTLMNDNVGLFLLSRPVQANPSTVRDALLKHLGPTPLWLVYGATYNSFDDLPHSLLQAVSVVKRAWRDNDGHYVQKARNLGLFSLLDDPDVSSSLIEFATDLLEPLLAHDRDHGSQLTETLCLVLTLGSVKETAEHLHFHRNTVKYRIRTAEFVLGKDLSAPPDRTALSLAAFVWTRRHDISS